jgi:hypothetical protein
VHQRVGGQPGRQRVRAERRRLPVRAGPLIPIAVVWILRAAISLRLSMSEVRMKSRTREYRYGYSWLDRNPPAVVIGVLVALFIAALGSYAVTGRYYAHHHVLVSKYDNWEGGYPPFTLTGAAGDRIWLAVRDSTVDGYWASDNGLQLLLPNRPPITLAPPKKESWPGEIETSVRSRETAITVGGSFTIPAADGTLEGTVKGDLRYPSARLNGTYTDEVKSIAVPVKITIIAAGKQSPWVDGTALRVLIWTCLTLATILTALGAIKVMRRWRGYGPPTPKDLVLGTMLALLSAFLAAMAGAGAQFFTGLVDRNVNYLIGGSPLDVPGQALMAALAVPALFGVLTRMLWD